MSAAVSALLVPAQETPAAQQVSTVIPQPAVATPSPAPNPLTPEKRGDVYMARRMYREAIDAYREALRTAPSAGIWNKMGIAYHQLMELDTAKRHYEAAIKLNRNYAEAINNLGALYYAKKNYRRAIKEYRKALKINPNSASIYSNLGTAYFARKKYKEALEAYQKALALDPEVFEHRSTYGVMLQERSVEERARFYYFLAKTYANSGMTDRAVQYVRKALEEGFRDRKKFLEEPEFASLQQLPEFQQLMASPPRAL
ncbi:MAG: tetratricopeptide repeat protein [Bryobacteraceae bacterium]|nr:tetratricopeptide repeat protein [Bryobacteraceae bacterium]